MTRRRERLETSIQREIEADLGAEPDLLIIRNSMGAARHTSDDGKEFFVPYGLGKGSPDLVGLLRVRDHRFYARDLALWFCLEVKTPEGVVEPDQEKCHEVWRRFGALVFVVRSVDDARAALAKARAIAKGGGS